MEPIVCNVRDIEAEERQALEHVVGQSLYNNQRLIIQIFEVVDASEVSKGDEQQAQILSDWTKVYEGLSSEQIDAIDKSIKTRAKLTRNVP